MSPSAAEIITPMTSPLVMSLFEGWLEAVPGWLATALSIIFTYLLVIVPSGAMLSWFDRKVGADIQARVGPKMAGPGGMLQPLADVFKLLQKEEVYFQNDNKAQKKMQQLWIGIAGLVLYSTLAVLPLGSLVLMFDVELSVFIPFLVSLISSVCLMFSGLSRPTAPGWYGGLRIFSQAIAGAFPALVSILAAGVHSEGYRWVLLADSQGASPIHWTFVSDPFQLLAMFIFLVSGLILLGIPPMDSAAVSLDFHGGVYAGISGRNIILMKLSRMYGFFLWSLMTVVIFLGAWKLPTIVTEYFQENHRWVGLQLLELLWLMTKTQLLMMVVLWVARANPRTRVAQITDFCWSVLSPLALISLIGTTTWRIFLGGR